MIQKSINFYKTIFLLNDIFEKEKNHLKSFPNNSRILLNKNESNEVSLKYSIFLHSQTLILTNAYSWAFVRLIVLK